jgi:hypothetical protein
MNTKEWTNRAVGGLPWKLESFYVGKGANTAVFDSDAVDARR